MAQLFKFGPAESETKFGWRNLLSIWTWQTQICKCRPWPRFPQKATSYRKPWQATSSRIKILSPGLLFKSRGLCSKGLQIDCLKEKISLVDGTHGIVLEHVWNILNLYCAVISLLRAVFSKIFFSYRSKWKRTDLDCHLWPIFQLTLRSIHGMKLKPV